MIVVAGEGVDASVVMALRSAGHIVYWIAEESPGVSDRIILEKAVSDKALLITEDKDFGELVFRSKLPHQGVVLLRLHDLQSAEKSNVVTRAFAQHSGAFIGSFSVIRSDSIRIRKAVA